MDERKRFQFSLWNLMLMTAVAAVVSLAISLRREPRFVVGWMMIGVPAAIGALFGGGRGLVFGLLAAVATSMAMSVMFTGWDLAAWHVDQRLLPLRAIGLVLLTIGLAMAVGGLLRGRKGVRVGVGVGLGLLFLFCAFRIWFGL